MGRNEEVAGLFAECRKQQRLDFSLVVWKLLEPHVALVWPVCVRAWALCLWAA
jgi:hypothetical protein